MHIYILSASPAAPGTHSRFTIADSRNCLAMKKIAPFTRCSVVCAALLFLQCQLTCLQAQTPAFPGAEGFGRFAKGARGVAMPEVYVVTTLSDSGPGSFRDAVSKPGRFVVFAVGGIITLQSDISVAPNTTIAAQTAPGDGIVVFNKRVTFTGSNNTICRFLRIRLGATGNSGKDASGLANGAHMIFDHLSITWGMDEVFSINWDGKNTAPDSITIQNSIIGQGLHRENHSAGGLIQTPDGGKVSMIRNLYISNKTRNPKVKGVNEFVNNVVYDWGNGNRLGDNLNYGWSGDAYIMGGSSGVSEVNIINNYFMGGPLTPPDKTTPFSRGTGTFYLYGSGNYFDNNKNGLPDGALVPYDTTGYPGIAAEGFTTQPFPYPAANPSLTALQAYAWVADSVGASYPRRDQVDGLLINEVRSYGTQGLYVYRETDMPFTNGGVGHVFNAPAPADTDNDGMPDAWEDAHGLNRNNKLDAVAWSLTHPQYLNIEVYINSLIATPPPAFVKPPASVTCSATSAELPAPSSTVTISWTDHSDNELFFVMERSADGIVYTDIAHPAANTTSYTDTAALLPNQTWYYRLKAVSGTDVSAYSAVVSIKTPPIATAPAIPTLPVPANGFQYAETTGGMLTLKWSGSTNTQQFIIYFGTDPGSLIQQAVIAYTANPSYAVSGLTDYTSWYWRIEAVNDKGTTTGEPWAFRTTKAFAPGLVGYWSFDETGGRQVTDSSQFQNHGVLGLDDDNLSIRVPGKINQALDFITANTDMYVVSIPHQDQLYLDKGSFSLSFWMKAPVALLPPDNNTSAYLLCKGSITRNAATGATGKRFDIEFKNKQFRFAIDDDNDAGGGGKDELQADGMPFFTGNWVHVVAVRDTAARKLQLYCNGSLVKETAIAKALAGIGETSALIVGNIGELEFGSTANIPAPYKGMLDELKMFNYTLSPLQVLALFHTSALPLQPFDPVVANHAQLEGYEPPIRLSWKGGIKTTHYKLYLGTDSTAPAYLTDIPVDSPFYALTNPVINTRYYWRVDAIGPAGNTTGATWSFTMASPKGLVAHYTLDDTSGTVAIDKSVYHHNGNVVGFSQPSWLPEGRFGGSLSFAGPANTAAVAVPHGPHLLFDQNSFTVSLWVKIATNTYNASTNGDCYLFHKGTFEANTGKWYGLQLRDGRLTFAIDDGVTKTDLSVTVNTGPYQIFTNQWKHIVAIRDVQAKQMKLYIDGVLAGSKSYTSGTTGRLVSLLIGNSPENKPYRDRMDDVRLYNYALPDSMIAALECKTSWPKPVIAITRNDPFYKGDPHTVYLGLGARQVTLRASVNTISPVHYNWSPATGLSNTQIPNPVFTPAAAGDYTFTVQATNEYGCTSDTSVTIHVIDVRCGNNNNKVLLCYKGHELCVHPVVALILLAIDHNIMIGGCVVPLITAK
jgi:hypothetical protein